MERVDRERLDKIEYHMSLLLKSLNVNKFPFIILIIERGVGKSQVESFLHTCERLDKEMHKQKQEGLLCFSHLLVLFERALPTNLLVGETLDALEKQGLYVSLVRELKSVK